MASETPASVADFRADYRREHVSPHYRGRVHFATTVLVSSGIVIYCLSRLAQVTPLEWLTIPITFLYANLVEYWGHRGPMHHPVWGLGLVYRRHARQHHRFFSDKAMAFESSRDYAATLFPVMMIAFYFVFFALPVGLALAWMLSANVAFLFVATAVGYFLNYELLHFAYHIPRDTWVARLPGMRRLRRLHTAHHDPLLMQRYNFNITYPIGDLVFRTLYRGSREPGAPGEQ